MFFWLNNFYSSLWRARTFSEDSCGEDIAANRKVRREIETKFHEIKTLIRNHYGPKIGQAIIEELHL